MNYVCTEMLEYQLVCYVLAKSLAIVGLKEYIYYQIISIHRKTSTLGEKLQKL